MDDDIDTDASTLLGGRAPKWKKDLFAYGRVSRKSQVTENQRLALARSGFPVDDEFWFEDHGVSGTVKALDRPRFSEMFKSLRRGDALAVLKLDRLGRDSEDILATLRALNGKGVQVRSLDIGADLDAAGDSLTAKLLRHIMAALSEIELDRIKERIHDGLARARAEGKKLGPRYKIPLEQRGTVLARMAGGESLRSLAREYGVTPKALRLMRERSLQDVPNPEKRQ